MQEPIPKLITKDNNESSNYYKKLVQFTFLLSVVVIVLGAYTRLSNAGLGCPDWPGCYGFLTVPHVDQVPPELGLLETGKAWKEMIHRYFAGSLGLLILITFISSLRLKMYHSTRVLSALLLLLVVFQATLGMLTVTMSLQPLIVVGHLLGGFLVVNLIWLLLLNINNDSKNTNLATSNNLAVNIPFVMSLFIIVLVLSQIALGGWLSANYAASFCNGLPFCDGFSSSNSWEQFSFKSIWQLPASSNYEFGVLPTQARLSIHLFHRFWAIITSVSVLIFVIRLYLKSAELPIKNAALMVIFLISSQVLLGIMMVFWRFPISMALAHNLCAALLLMSLIRLSYQLSKVNKNNHTQ